uniref:Uncharacterized protein n=1 Tax=Anguilla anguilla TaxID=7936 RepID=A0A0E9QUL0_ANGAN
MDGCTECRNISAIAVCNHRALVQAGWINAWHT